jgi:glycosyltransferase involved in cell wall biosynthesis
MTVLAVVIPCYNEQEVLPETCSRMTALLARLVDAGKISRESRIYFVDDGSRDRTWSVIQSFVEEHRPVVGIKLTRNRGHQNALFAGLFSAEGDVIVSIDADLQDDINAIEEMLDHFHDGCDVVYGVRKRRDTDTFFKRFTAEGFYRVIALLGAQTVTNHADYRLLSRRAIDALKEFREVNLFLRGIVPLIGYRSAIVYYDRQARFAGESKYPLGKMIGLALDAVTSFSVVPLRFITLLGGLVFLLTVAMSGYVLWIRFLTDIAVPGWASTVLPVYFLGGVQILCLGVIGEYLGKLYAESKARPRYLIEEIVRPRSSQGLLEREGITAEAIVGNSRNEVAIARSSGL